MKHARIAAEVFNRPHMIEPGYGRVFVSALTQHGFNIRSLADAEGIQYDAAQMDALAQNFSRGDRKLFAQADNIAIIPIEGTLAHRYGSLDPSSGMTGYDGIQAKLEAALADDTVAGIVLDINSPGGAVAGCFDLADQIYEARAIKPVWAVCDELACSAAYALASSATRIVAPRTAQIGSIGVLTMHADQSKMLADLGVDVTFIFAGDHKVDGNAFEPLPDDVKAQIQADIDTVYSMFTGLVGRNRAALGQAGAANTQARVFSAADALEFGLIDAVMPTHQVLDAFQRELAPSGARQLFQRGATAMGLSNPFGRKPKAQNSADAPNPDQNSMTLARCKERFGSGANWDTQPRSIDSQAKIHCDANGVVRGMAVAGPGQTFMVLQDLSAEYEQSLINAGFEINRDADGKAVSASLAVDSIDEMLAALPPGVQTPNASQGDSATASALPNRSSKADAPDAKNLTDEFISSRIHALNASGFDVESDENLNVTSIKVAEGADSADVDALLSAYVQGVISREQLDAVIPHIGALATGERLYTEVEAREAFTPADNSASLDALVDLCAEHKLDALAKPLHARGVTAEQAEAVMADVGGIRDKMAATFPEDPQTASAMADKFALAAHAQATPQFADALGALMVEACAKLSGQEINHHQPPAKPNASGSGINSHRVYDRINKRS